MKEFEEVRLKILGYPSGATVPLSHWEIDVLKANSRWEQGCTFTTGQVFGRKFGLEARPGSKLTEEDVVAAAREIRGLRVGDRFRVRCPQILSMKRLTIEELEKAGAMMMDTCEHFVLTPELAARVEASKKSNLD